MITIYQQDNVMSRSLIGQTESIVEAVDMVISMDSSFPYVEIDLPELSFIGSIHREELVAMLDELADV